MDFDQASSLKPQDENSLFSGFKIRQTSTEFIVVMTSKSRHYEDKGTMQLLDGGCEHLGYETTNEVPYNLKNIKIYLENTGDSAHPMIVEAAKALEEKIAQSKDFTIGERLRAAHEAAHDLYKQSSSVSNPGSKDLKNQWYQAHGVFLAIQNQILTEVNQAIKTGNGSACVVLAPWVSANPPDNLPERVIEVSGLGAIVNNSFVQYRAPGDAPGYCLHSFRLDRVKSIEPSKLTPEI